MKHFQDLIAWQRGMELFLEVYTITSKFPREELYGLTSQVRRASSSILANIAEGFGRFTFADKAHKYLIARGEATEVEAFLIMAMNLKCISPQETQRAIDLAREVGRLLSGLISACKRKRSAPESSS